MSVIEAGPEQGMRKAPTRVSTDREGLGTLKPHLDPMLGQFFPLE